MDMSRDLERELCSKPCEIGNIYIADRGLDGSLLFLDREPPPLCSACPIGESRNIIITERLPGDPPELVTYA